MLEFCLAQHKKALELFKNETPLQACLLANDCLSGADRCNGDCFIYALRFTMKVYLLRNNELLLRCMEEIAKIDAVLNEVD